MLGWHISVYRQVNGGQTPANSDSPRGDRLAVWQTGLGGLDWIHELVKEGKVIDLGGTGYPCRFTATCEVLIPRIAKEPPGARATWASGPSDILLKGWEGKTVLDEAALSGCRPGEWLLVEAWDES